MAQNIEPDMATYWFNSMMVQVFNHKLEFSQLFKYPVEFDCPRKQV